MIPAIEWHLTPAPVVIRPREAEQSRAAIDALSGALCAIPMTHNNVDAIIKPNISKYVVTLRSTTYGEACFGGSCSWRCVGVSIDTVFNARSPVD